jgi:hypothetical protein
MRAKYPISGILIGFICFALRKTSGKHTNTLFLSQGKPQSRAIAVEPKQLVILPMERATLLLDIGTNLNFQTTSFK